MIPCERSYYVWEVGEGWVGVVGGGHWSIGRQGNGGLICKIRLFLKLKSLYIKKKMCSEMKKNLWYKLYHFS